ncbi:hypothetical protein TL5118_03432 [Thalassovita autumnalis]|uniref:Uncharacterized protein n=1 Tax=Thalassovita autumnalis TaxID=2072972 RepID=A0A0P1FVI8_9RHOB|nr:hypothetical protein [Thalassovita autumnalis]CUH69469.1 hypothetical protein TL5118_03432 [Thalassovita autumnalis]CUH72872.1 hypothetical protein TL5120_02672 [Thalassovita autumnalis]
MAQIVKPKSKATPPQAGATPKAPAHDKRTHHPRFVFTDFAMI